MAPIRSNWESLRGETETQWSWGSAIAFWLNCAVLGAVAGIVAGGLV